MGSQQSVVVNRLSRAVYKIGTLLLLHQVNSNFVDPVSRLSVLSRDLILKLSSQLSVVDNRLSRAVF